MRLFIAAAGLAVLTAPAQQDVALKDLMPKGMVIGVAINQRQFDGTDTAAVEIITKPRVGVHGFLVDSAAQLVDAIRGAARARLRAPRALAAQPRLTADAILPPRVRPFAVTTERIIVIGASTGGTEALRRLLQEMPPDSPGLVIVQHMPEIFTAAFARRLNETCRIEVREAVDGDHVAEGRALIAPGNRHTLLRRSGARYVVLTSKHHEGFCLWPNPHARSACSQPRSQRAAP